MGSSWVPLECGSCLIRRCTGFTLRPPLHPFRCPLATGVPGACPGPNGAKSAQKSTKTTLNPMATLPQSRDPVSPLLPGLRFPLFPGFPGAPGSRSYRNKETKELQDPREAQIKKILRRGPGYRPPNPPGPTLSGPVISGEPLIPGCPGWTGWFGERYLLAFVSRSPDPGFRRSWPREPSSNESIDFGVQGSC